MSSAIPEKGAYLSCQSYGRNLFVAAKKHVGSSLHMYICSQGWI